MYNWEKYRENEVVNIIYEQLKKLKSEIPILEEVSKSVTYRNPFWNCLNAKKSLYPQKLFPERLILPDLIFVYKISESIQNGYIDKHFIVALEFKWFKKGKSNKYLNNKFSKAFREIGQPYANYIYGYDSVCLIHVFSYSIEKDILKNYLKYDIPSIGDTLKFLKLPIAYIALSLLDVATFRIYYPDKIEKIEGYPNFANYIFEKSKKSRNPIFVQKYMGKEYQALRERRECLKKALEVKKYTRDSSA